MKALVLSSMLFAGIVFSAQAAEEPKKADVLDFPKFETDVALVTADPEKFFQARISDTANREKRNKAKTAYDEQLKTLNGLLGNGKPAEIRKAEYDLGKLRTARLDLEQKYGDCLVHPVKPEDRGKDNLWFVSDGSCRMHFPEPPKKEDKEKFDIKEERKKAFDTLVEGFTRAKAYVRDDAKKTQGIDQVLFFTIVDPKSGKILDGKDDFGASPQYAFISVKTFELGPVITAAAYYFQNRWEVKQTPTGRELHFQYNTAKSAPTKELAFEKPAGFKIPTEVKETVTRAGDTRKVNVTELEEVRGMWYVRESDGYIRYWTVGNFKTPGELTNYISKVGGPVLHNTLVVTSERGTEKKF